MKWFANLSTPVKLILAFGAMWLLLAIVIVTAYRNLEAIYQSARQTHEVYNKIAIQLTDLRATQNLNRARVLEMMEVVDRQAQEEIAREIKSDSEKNDTMLIELSKINTQDAWFSGRLEDMIKAKAVFRQMRDQVISLIREGKIEEAKQLSLGVQDQQFGEIRDIALDLTDYANKNAENQLERNRREAETATRLFILVGVLALLLGVAMVLILHFTMARPLGAISNVASRIASGDLSADVPADGRTDELGAMMQSFRQMVESLRHTISDITEGIALLGASASEIVAGTSQVASSTAETASAISETTTTVEEVRQAVRLSSDKARGVADNSQRVAQVSQSGRDAVEEAAAGMAHIRDQMESIARTIVRLSEQSQMIGGIIASVTDLADQSNLLAVNAAIEAARAGDHGKGFAVVAQEVKSLAEQSKQATQQIRGILNDVQKATSAAVLATEQGSKAVEAGVKQSAQAGEAIRVLAESAGEAAQAATQIVASGRQQVVGMDQIGLAMENINQAGTQTAASMRQAEVAARNLHELGQRLKTLVEQFRM